MKLKKGDMVKILLGKDKGKNGKIEKIFPRNDSVLVDGVNQYKKHVKSRAANQKSEIVTITKPLVASKVALICPKCKKPTRVGYKIVKSEKIRVCRKCKVAI